MVVILYQTKILTIMGVFSTVVQEIGDVINGLSVSAKEKQQIQADIIALLYRHESELTKGRLGIVDREAQGNWLQRSWRPIVMLVFTLVILLGVFNPSPLLSETSRFWDLLEIGLGGYVIGRSGEKITGNLLGKRKS